MKPGPGAVPRTVDEYLSGVPKDARAALQRLREIVGAAAPDAEEVISYRMPAFRHHGILVYYAAFEDHCSFFPGSVRTQRRFASELKPFAVGKGTVHFTPERPLPADLVRRIVKARVAENEAREAGKRGRGAGGERAEGQRKRRVRT